MFRWWRERRRKREALANYREAVFQAVLDKKISSEEKSRISSIVSENGLALSELATIQKEAFQGAFSSALSDGLVSDQEALLLNDLVDLFGVSAQALGLDQERFNSARYLELLGRGELITFQERPEGVIIPEGESLHFFIAAALAKRRRVTTSVSYSGPTASIKLMKGVHYRVGSINLGRSTSEKIAYEDIGFVFITDQQIGYKGPKKHLNIPLKKVKYVEINDGVLNLFVSGRENPHLIIMPEYQVVLSILSVLLNR